MQNEYELSLSELLEPEDLELSEREQLALQGKIQMTQGLFNGCISKCDFTTANELFFKYPEFSKNYANLREIEIKKNQN